jgi:hypothetical protein
MLRSSELREACKYCVKLHNYYIHNYKMCDDIMVQYKEHHFLVRDDIFVVSFSDLYDLFTFDTLDISHALFCIVSLQKLSSSLYVLHVSNKFGILHVGT